VNQLVSRVWASAVDAVGLARAQSLRVAGDKVYLQVSIRAGSLAGVVKAIVGATIIWSMQEKHASPWACW
jgi:hypothetical protein